jgi:hypothetical protein
VVDSVAAHHHWSGHQWIVGIAAACCEHIPEMNMTKTKTFTLNEDQIRTILHILASHRPEMPEQMQQVQSVIDLMQMVPFNEGR